MNLEKTLTYVTHHSEAIIQWLFFAILAISSFLIARSLFAKSSKEEGVVSSDVHASLQKILEQTVKLENVSLDKLNSQDMSQVEGQVQTLRAELKEREAEINRLRDSSAGGDPAANAKAAEEVSALNSRISELEARLAEYAILEDDIADLSLFKDENERLRAEVDRLKAGGAVAADAPAPAPVPVAAPDPAPEVVTPPAEVEAGEKIVEEFAQAVAQEVNEPAPESVPEPTPQAPAPPVPRPPAPVEAAAKEEADDLFAEFARPMPELSDAEALDTEKMMSEMASLVGIEPALGNALEEGIDTDKMAKEASSFEKA